MTIKTVLVTGSNGGLGTEIVRRLAADGYRVIGLDLKRIDAGLFVECDLETLVTDAAYAVDTEREIRALLAGEKLYSVINNAALQIVGGWKDIPVADYLRSIQVNALAPIQILKMFAEDLTASRGIVVNISSIHVRLTKPEFAPYSISKSALSGISRALAVECGDKFRVVEIQPAAMATKMLVDGFAGSEERLRKLESCHPCGEVGSPDALAQVVSDLLGNDSFFINGAVIEFGGGIFARLHDP
jgi:NAD(P)-dependent dehydrogenase (short-subunit alcohol dehydrogenase family)